MARPLIRRPLTDGWRVHAASGPAQVSNAISAVVPGVVHLDLMRAGLIPDPYLDDNESALAWIGLVDWTYETTFALDPDDGEHEQDAARQTLVFDGLDTVATVIVNGHALAEVANQHRTYRLDVTDIVTAGQNRLTVAFRSPVRYANAQSVALGARPGPYPSPFDAIRKSACSFGWDWGIATATSGIWREVRLESWSIARLDEVRVVASPDGEGGIVRVHVGLERAADTDLELTVRAAGAEQTACIAASASSADVELLISDVERWWPAGHGAQPLYDVDVILTAEGAPLDTATCRVGFRDLRWDTEADAAGTPFTLIVNDRPIYVKGVNWIPDDAFPSRVDRTRYRARLEQAKNANLNLIRVWGGGIYESEEFYDLADELGLLVWQDFLFACAAYAEEEPLRGEIEAEARDNVSRLAHRASLALFTGNNENTWGYEDWGWKALLDGKTWGAHYYYELFPQVIGEIAPHVPYAPGSPFSPGGGWDGHLQTGPHPNDEQHGTMHLWEQWNRLDWPTYRDHRPRFVAEFGWQGPPAWTTVTRAISDDPLTPDSPGMIVHQKAIDGNTKLAAGLVAHYRVPDDIESWHWAMQLNQANAVGCALDWFRSLAPHNSGAIVWQLNDCWPVTSWAAIDGDGREKPLLFAIKNAFAPRVVTIQPAADGLDAVLSNDTDDEWGGDLVLRRVGFDGLVRTAHTSPVTVAPRSTMRVQIPADIVAAENAASELLLAEASGNRGLWWFAEPRDSALAAPGLTAEVARRDDGSHDVTIAAGALTRDLTLLVDRLAPDATVDRGLVTLLPGEQAVFRITGVAEVDAAAVLHPLVARSGNQLVGSV
ncbi:glycoside hydrolase family 2 protein [Microbacterium sp.]|uniref:glycoside hydrolase family 2 protein n=1 Tax=Microbacterium sp. TaxID=51671 RepID=UPI003F9D4FFA